MSVSFLGEGRKEGVMMAWLNEIKLKIPFNGFHPK